MQLLVVPGHLGGEEVTFQIRDEFDMGYDLHGCLSKCLLSTRGPNGENIFYSPYTICLSVRKEDHWLLRVRLVGRAKSEDVDLICPKPKMKRPRGMHHTTRRHSTKMSTPTSSHPWTSTLLTVPFPSDSPTVNTVHTTTGSGAPEGQVTTEPAVIATTKDMVFPSGQQTETSPQNVTLRSSTHLVQTAGSPGKLTPSQCLVPTGRITCLNSTVSRHACLDYRCCHDPLDSVNRCYYGNTVTVHCFPDGLFQLVLSRYVTSPPLRLSSVVLGPGNCSSPTIMGDFLEFKGLLSSCSSHQFLQGRLVYELSLTAKPDVLISPLGSITRDSTLMVLSQCQYNNTLSNVSLVVLDPELPTVTSTGVLSVELRISKGSSFASFYLSEDFPLQIPLRELVYLEARLLQPSDPRLHLRLHHCWGAPSLDPASTVRWPVIYDGCPFLEDDTLTKILPGSIPSSYQRFAVSAFTFIGFNYNTQVYFLCSVSVCLPSSLESCASDCANPTRSRRAQPDISLYLVGTNGPLIFQQDKSLGTAGLQHLTSSLPGVVFAVTFLLIVLLPAAALVVKSGFMSLKR